MNVIQTEKTSSFPPKSGGENRPHDEKQDGGHSTGFDIFNEIIRAGVGEDPPEKIIMSLKYI